MRLNLVSSLNFPNFMSNQAFKKFGFKKFLWVFQFHFGNLIWIWIELEWWVKLCFHFCLFLFETEARFNRKQPTCKFGTNLETIWQHRVLLIYCQGANPTKSCNVRKNTFKIAVMIKDCIFQENVCLKEYIIVNCITKICLGTCFKGKYVLII